MTTVLTYLRTHISPQTREVLYFATVAAVAAVGVPAQESGDLQQAVTSVVLTGIAVVLAVLNSSPRMAAVYLFLAAVGSAAQIVAVQHEGAAWAGYLGIAAVVVGKIVAGLRAPTVMAPGLKSTSATDAAKAMTELAKGGFGGQHRAGE